MKPAKGRLAEQSLGGFLMWIFCRYQDVLSPSWHQGITIHTDDCQQGQLIQSLVSRVIIKASLQKHHLLIDWCPVWLNSVSMLTDTIWSKACTLNHIVGLYSMASPHSKTVVCGWSHLKCCCMAGTHPKQRYDQVGHRILLEARTRVSLGARPNSLLCNVATRKC